MPKKLGE